MSSNPTDIANFNLVNWAGVQGDLFSSEPKTLTVPQKDSNGAISEYQIQNRGMFQKAVWDDMGAALGQMEKTFYVDSENGDDSNEGSSSNPFKTLKKACDSVLIGGSGTIYIESDMTFENDFTEIDLVRKSIRVEIRGFFNVQYKIKNITATPCLKFKLNSSHISFHINSNNGNDVKFVVENKVENSTYVDYLIMPGTLLGGFSSCTFYIFNHTDNNTILTVDNSILICLSNWGMSSSSGFSLGYNAHIQGDGAIVEFTNNSKLITGLTACPITFSGYTTGREVDESSNKVELTDLLDGIVRDVNGVPINVISCINL